jgi:hypothetical protein
MNAAVVRIEPWGEGDLRRGGAKWRVRIGRQQTH